MTSDTGHAADMSGKRVLVTGGSAGIGYETARALARAGADVTIASRHQGRITDAAETLSADAGRPVTAMRMDLADLDSIRAFAERFAGNGDRLDVLVNNAGAWNPRRRETIDGIERTWAVNHLGPFLLTSLLMPLLQRAEAGRIVTVASGAHNYASLDFADLELTNGYAAARAYGQSKLANIMFTYALARRLEGSGITANCLHPGLVATRFFRFVPVLGPLMHWLSRPLMISPQQGAQTVIYLAADPEVVGKSGTYYYRCAPRASNAASQVIVDQERLWEISTARTGADWQF